MHGRRTQTLAAQGQGRFSEAGVRGGEMYYIIFLMENLAIYHKITVYFFYKDS